MLSLLRHLNYSKKIIFSFSIRMRGRNFIFDAKKISKSNFYKKQKAI